MKIAIINYDAGNVKSVQFALQRLGYNSILTNDEKSILEADKVIFPGVGEASSAMNKLKEKQLHTLLPTLKQPVLGICLGMQLLCNFTEENNTNGLGIFEIDVVKFKNNVKIPQIGWNQISNLNTPLFKNVKEKEYVYLVHSYYVPFCKYTIATTNYNGNYSSAICKNNFYGVQFHPEKSSTAGAEILKNFLNL